MRIYSSPTNIWEVNERLRLDEHLNGEDDPRWVDTEDARGEYSLNTLRRVLGVHPSKLRLSAHEQRYCLFSGHRGCGKSTELRRISNDLHDPNVYYVVFADATEELDVNNLRYQDILLHLAGRLVGQLLADGIEIPPVHLQRLHDWFTERVEKHDLTRAFAIDAKTGAEATVGLPFLAKIFASMSMTIKTNSTYKEEIRRALRNSFSDFADAFNRLIEVAEDSIRTQTKGHRILFVLDGTDRLTGDDARALFIADVHQLQQVRGLFIYCAPVSLVYEGSAIGQNFTDIFRLPMVKVTDEDGSHNDRGRTAMRDILHLRAAPDLFDHGVADYLIDHCGGHPRDLLRLLINAFKYAENERFDEASARHAVRELANDYRRILDPEDYDLLASVDSGHSLPSGSERVRDLLYNLALLEYNNYYWRSHPVIRTTEAYQEARAAIAKRDDV